ncbi:hypothetical protein F511_28275 [Dorcoceras hygrometricum]|uniref:Uncharacterized protein n=1 Tax=Dorcoceras hygrometricum TaxID=472368 RepID=A0A2Z7DEU7_9LAMI|nr:hypothetical protein F511_28275 [Dorcoceras hygrometricum]
MASSLISNSHHIDFEAVFGMEDTDLVQMFESHIVTGLKNFLGCPAVFNKDALTEFFANSSVREDGLVVSTVNGVSVEISEEVFAAKFELPVEGLTDLSEVGIRFLRRSIVVIELGIKHVAYTHDIPFQLWQPLPCFVVASLFSYQDARASGDSALSFPLCAEWLATTVHRLGVDASGKGGRVGDVTKKRPAAGDAEVAPIVKKKRTTKGKPVAANRLPVEEPVGVRTTSGQPVVEVATGEQEPVGGLRIASIIEATTGDADAAIEQVLAQLDLVIQDSDVEISDSIETWFDRAFDEEFVTADQENQDSKDDIDFDVDNQELPVFDDTRTVPEAGGSKSFGVDKAGEKGIGTTHSTEEHMSIDDLLMQISEDMMLPSVTAAEITKIRLGDSLNIHEVQERDCIMPVFPAFQYMIKGKKNWKKMSLKKLPKSVVEEELVPHCYLIEPVQYWGAAPYLIKTWGWARVCIEIIRYSMFGCLRPVCREIVVYNLGVERIPDYLLSDFQRGVCTDTFVGFFSGSSVQTNSEIELRSSDGDTVYRSPSPILREIDSFEESLQFDLGPVVSTNALEEQLYYVESTESPPPIPQQQESSSSSSDSQMNFDTTDFPLDDTTEAQTSLPAATVEAIDNLRAFILQRIDDSNSAILSKLHTLERDLRDALHDQDDNARKLINSVCQDAHTISDVQKIHLNDVKKIVLAQGVTAGADSLEIRKAINAVDAKILLLDGQVATIRSEHLEFQARISADLLSLSTQIGNSSPTFVAVMPKRGNEVAASALYLLLFIIVKELVML